jgi:hypothetical protein
MSPTPFSPTRLFKAGSDIGFDITSFSVKSKEKSALSRRIHAAQHLSLDPTISPHLVYEQQ